MLSSENHGRPRGEGCESIFTLCWRQTNLRRDDRITVRGSNWIPQVTKIDQKVCKCQAMIHSFSEVAVINSDSVPWKRLIILHKFKVWQDKWAFVMYSVGFEAEKMLFFRYLVTQTAPAGHHRTEWEFLVSAQGGTGWQMHTLQDRGNTKMSTGDLQI